MEDHCLFFICSFILGSTCFLLVPSDAQENGKTENIPLIIICWHATPLQLIRKDALDDRYHLAIPRWPTMSQARDDLVHRLLGSRVGLDDYDRLKVLYHPLQDCYNVSWLPTCTWSFMTVAAHGKSGGFRSGQCGPTGHPSWGWWVGPRSAFNANIMLCLMCVVNPRLA